MNQQLKSTIFMLLLALGTYALFWLSLASVSHLVFVPDEFTIKRKEQYPQDFVWALVCPERLFDRYLFYCNENDDWNYISVSHEEYLSYNVGDVYTQHD